MSKHIAVVPGDGIGPEVIDAGMRVLEHVNSAHNLGLRFTHFGWNADEAEEREMPVGRDGGYVWRLNTYWRILERDGGIFIQCESVSLTRGIPAGFGWLIGPFVTSIPRESLTFTLETTHRELMRAK